MTGVTLVLVNLLVDLSYFIKAYLNLDLFEYGLPKDKVFPFSINFQVVLEVSTVCNTQRQKPGKGRWLGLLFTESRKHKVGAKKL